MALFLVTAPAVEPITLTEAEPRFSGVYVIRCTVDGANICEPTESWDEIAVAFA